VRQQYSASIGALPGGAREAAAAALLDEGHEGLTYTLTGPEAITYEQIARDLSAATGRTIEYVDIPYDAAREAMLQAGLPRLMADSIVDLFVTMQAGSMERTTDAVRALTGRLEEYRVEVDDRDETVGKRIRDAEVEKIPYVIVYGDKESDESLAVRKHGGEQSTLSLEALRAEISEVATL
jgi:hypothetical protein